MTIGGGILPFRVNGQEVKLRAITVVLEKPGSADKSAKLAIQECLPHQTETPPIEMMPSFSTSPA
jgi:hypothetical protein